MCEHTGGALCFDCVAADAAGDLHALMVIQSHTMALAMKLNMLVLRLLGCVCWSWLKVSKQARKKNECAACVYHGG